MKASLRGKTKDLLQALEPVAPGLRSSHNPDTSTSLEIAFSGNDDLFTSQAELLEDEVVTARPVKPAAEPVFGAFLDGIQESHVVGWLQQIPIVMARVSAVVRVRDSGRMKTWASDETIAAYAPWSRVAPGRIELGDVELRDVREEAEGSTSMHPFAWVQSASKAIKQDREALERDLAARFCEARICPLYIDGNLPSSEQVRESPFATGVIKSHNTLYVERANLDVVLGLEEGERSSVFLVGTRRRPAVASWYLRLRSPKGESPFWGLVRVEAPLGVIESSITREADARSAWILAERSPVALPDRRWDTMVYGIRDCEEYLKHG